MVVVVVGALVVVVDVVVGASVVVVDVVGALVVVGASVVLTIKEKIYILNLKCIHELTTNFFVRCYVKE